MPITKPPYPAQFCEQIVERVQAGRKPADLAKELGCHITSILRWMRKVRPSTSRASPSDKGVNDVAIDAVTRIINSGEVKKHHAGTYKDPNSNPVLLRRQYVRLAYAAFA